MLSFVKFYELSDDKLDLSKEIYTRFMIILKSFFEEISYIYIRA